MKRLLSLTLLLSATALSAQSFEWDKPTPVSHPKEVQLAVDTGSAGTQNPQDGVAGIYAPDADGKTTAYGEIYRASEMTGSHPALPLGTLLRVTNIENGRSVVVRITDRGQECDECLVTLSTLAARQLGMAEKSQVKVEPNGFSNWNPVPQSTPVTSTPVKASTPASEPVVDQQITPNPSLSSPDRPSVFMREVTSPAPAPAISEAPQGEPIVYQEVVIPPSPTVGSNRQARGVETAPDAGQFTIQLAAYNNESYAVGRVKELKEKGLDNAYYRSVTKESGEVINRVYAGLYESMTEAQAASRAIAEKYNIKGIVSKM